MRKVIATLAVTTIAALAVIVACQKISAPGPTEPREVIATNQIPANAGVIAPTASPKVAPTPDTSQPLSYVKFNKDGSGIFCALPQGGLSIILAYTVPGSTDPTYGQLIVDGIKNQCVPIPAAVLVVQACGDVAVQIDVTQYPNSGRHVGHVVTDTIHATLTCPRPTPTPTPSPTPSPTPTPRPTPTPSPTPTPEATPTPCVTSGTVTVTATSAETGEWSLYANASLLWHGHLAKNEKHSEKYAPNGATLRFKYGGVTYAQAEAVCPEAGILCTGTITYTCGCK